MTESTRARYMGGCAEVSDRLGIDDAYCCGSCHVDADEYDYNLCEIESDDLTAYYEVCCAIRQAVTDELRPVLFAPKPEGAEP